LLKSQSVAGLAPLRPGATWATREDNPDALAVMVVGMAVAMAGDTGAIAEGTGGAAIAEAMGAMEATGTTPIAALAAEAAALPPDTGTAAAAAAPENEVAATKPNPIESRGLDSPPTQVFSHP
jgi:hypothetical protein